MASKYLQEKEEKSIYIIREAYALFKRACLLWSIGKDSAVLLALTKKAFLGAIPFSVIHIDTGFEFRELIDFRDKLAKNWNFNLVVARPEHPDKNLLKNPVEFFHYHKTLPLLDIIKKMAFEIVYLGIRGDEHGIRAKERYFSVRGRNGELDFKKQKITAWDFFPRTLAPGCHYRIHPLLHWTEIDIWEYIDQEKIPIPNLYFSRNGMRYRSLDCEIACDPIKSDAKTIKDIIVEIKNANTYERQGRAQDKEDAYAMEKLRSMGYM